MSNSAGPAQALLTTIDEDALALILDFVESSSDIESLRRTCSSLRNLLGSAAISSEHLKDRLCHRYLPRISVQIAAEFMLDEDDDSSTDSEGSSLISHELIEEWKVAFGSDRLTQLSSSEVEILIELPNDSTTNSNSPLSHQGYLTQALWKYADSAYEHCEQVSITQPPRTTTEEPFEDNIRLSYVAKNEESKQALENSHRSITNSLSDWKNQFHDQCGITHKMTLNTCRLFSTFILHIQFVPRHETPEGQTPKNIDQMDVLKLEAHARKGLFIGYRNTIQLKWGVIYGGNEKMFRFEKLNKWKKNKVSKVRLISKLIWFYLGRFNMVDWMEKYATIDLKLVYNGEQLAIVKKYLKEGRREDLFNYLTIRNNVMLAYKRSVLEGKVNPFKKPKKEGHDALRIVNYFSLMSIEGMTDLERRRFVTLYLKSIYKNELNISDSHKRRYAQAYPQHASLLNDDDIHFENSENSLEFRFFTLEFNRSHAKTKHNTLSFPKHPIHSRNAVTHKRADRLFQTTKIGHVDKVMTHLCTCTRYLNCVNASVICCCWCGTWCCCYKREPIVSDGWSFAWLFNGMACMTHRWFTTLDCGVCFELGSGCFCDDPKQAYSLKTYTDYEQDDRF